MTLLIILLVALNVGAILGLFYPMFVRKKKPEPVRFTAHYMARFGVMKDSGFDVVWQNHPFNCAEGYIAIPEGTPHEQMRAYAVKEIVDRFQAVPEELSMVIQRE